MTNAQLLDTLCNLKSAKALELARNPPPPPLAAPLPEINWVERQMKKNELMLKFMKILTCCFIGIFFFCVLPVFLAYPSVGRGMLLGLPPTVFMALSWVAGAWYAWDKDKSIFYACTMGAMPLRIGIGLMWSLFVLQLSDVNQGAYFIGAMVFWVAFTIVEVKILIEFSQRFPRDARQIEP